MFFLVAFRRSDFCRSDLFPKNYPPKKVKQSVWEYKLTQCNCTFTHGKNCSAALRKCRALQIGPAVAEPLAAFDVLTESETSGRPHRRRRLH
jgi:hypothetical protein